MGHRVRSASNKYLFNMDPSTLLTPFDPLKRLMPDSLFNKVDTAEEGVKREKPWHRQAAYFIAGGYSPKQVAEICEVNVDTVRNILRTPWFQKEVLNAQEADGGRDLIQMMKAEVLNSHLKLMELRDADTTPRHVVANICNGLIDRVYGKALTRVEVDSTHRSADPVAEVAALEAENERLRKATTGGLS